MNMKALRKSMDYLDLKKYKLIQTSLNSLVIFKMKYRYTDCIYVNIDDNKASVRKERVFDNKYLNLSIKRLFISKVDINEEDDLIKYIEEIL